jgi:acyl-CoA synthetase (AMP-forming)/AMP-acid ligase II
MLDGIQAGIASNLSTTAIIDRAGSHSYADLDARIHTWAERFISAGIDEGSVVTIESDYSLDGVAAFLAAAIIPAIVIPISADSGSHLDAFLEIAEAEWRVDPVRNTITASGRSAGHPFYEELRRRRTAGLVLFTSGSSGRHKAAVHDLDRVAQKFTQPGKRFRTLVFLQPDHIGGLNTLFYTLANGGTVVVPQDRSPGHVCDLIERHHVQLLPTSPTFLNLLMMTRDPDRHSLSSLQLITYGTEPMPPATLERLRATFPGVRLQQTYGLTELGILRSQSRPDGTLWVRVGGEGFDVQVRDGLLWIKAHSAMLGYLNAPSPFSADGYFDTGDRVEVDGDWIRILGRDSELINVGGNKVYPAEVESVLLDMANVADVAVYGAPHPLTGQIVAATVQLRSPEAMTEFKLRLRTFCMSRLPPYKIPAKISLTESPVHSARFKRVRKPTEALE